MRLTQSQLLTVGGFWSFLVFGFIDNLKGPLLPEMIRSGQFNYAQSGTLILASYIGFVIATLTAGLLADRLGNRLVMWIAALCLLAGGICIGLRSDYIWLVSSMFGLGYGLGAIELGANALMIQLHWRAPGRYLNLLSVFHGCGSLIVPLVAAQLIGLTWHWQTIYSLSWAMALPLLLLFARSTSHADALSVSQSATAPADGNPPVRLWPHGFTPIMLRYYLLIATYVAVELSIGTWMMEYLQTKQGLSVDQSSYYLSAFFVLLMLGRLSGAWLVERCDYLSAITGALVLTLACLTAGIYGGQWRGDWAWHWLLPLSGLSMSIVFPTVTASVARVHRGQAGAIMGLLFACGGVGGALGPWMVGQVSQRWSLTDGLATILVINVVAIVCAVSLRSGRQSLRKAAREPRSAC